MCVKLKKKNNQTGNTASLVKGVQVQMKCHALSKWGDNSKIGKINEPPTFPRRIGKFQLPQPITT